MWTYFLSPYEDNENSMATLLFIVHILLIATMHGKYVCLKLVPSFNFNSKHTQKNANENHKPERFIVNPISRTLWGHELKNKSISN